MNETLTDRAQPGASTGLLIEFTKEDKTSAFIPYSRMLWVGSPTSRTPYLEIRCDIGDETRTITINGDNLDLIYNRLLFPRQRVICIDEKTDKVQINFAAPHNKLRL